MDRRPFFWAATRDRGNTVCAAMVGLGSIGLTR